MKSSFSQRGNATMLAVIIGALVIIGAGVAYFSTQSTPTEDQATVEQVMEKKEAMVKQDTTPAPTPSDAMIKKDGEAMVKYQGTVLAGTKAPLLDFNQADFDAAVKSDKLVVLYFFANWCPVCLAEFPVMQTAFNELTTDQVIGFRVNYKDNQTEAAETALAREHGVAYQHTKVFVKNGQQIQKSPETWGADRYLTEITKALGK